MARSIGRVGSVRWGRAGQGMMVFGLQRQRQKLMEETTAPKNIPSRAFGPACWRALSRLVHPATHGRLPVQWRLHRKQETTVSALGPTVASSTTASISPSRRFRSCARISGVRAFAYIVVAGPGGMGVSDGTHDWCQQSDWFIIRHTTGPDGREDAIEVEQVRAEGRARPAGNSTKQVGAHLSRLDGPRCAALHIPELQMVGEPLGLKALGRARRRRGDRLLCWSRSDRNRPHASARRPTCGFPSSRLPPSAPLQTNPHGFVGPYGRLWTLCVLRETEHHGRRLFGTSSSDRRTILSRSPRTLRSTRRRPSQERPPLPRFGSRVLAAPGVAIGRPIGRPAVQFWTSTGREGKRR